MDIIESLRDSASHRWTGIYLRVLAGILLYGAFVHIANMIGLSGKPWSATPIHWRIMDVVLLVFNVVVAMGLWFKNPWAVIAVVLGIIAFQIIPYTVFRRHFIQTPEDANTLNGLIFTESVLIAILFVLVIARK